MVYTIYFTLGNSRTVDEWSGPNDWHNAEPLILPYLEKKYDSYNIDIFAVVKGLHKTKTEFPPKHSAKQKPSYEEDALQKDLHCNVF